MAYGFIDYMKYSDLLNIRKGWGVKNGGKNISYSFLTFSFICNVISLE